MSNNLETESPKPVANDIIDEEDICSIPINDDSKQDDDMSIIIDKDSLETDNNKPIEAMTIPNPMCGINYCYQLKDIIGLEPVLSVKVSDSINDLHFDSESLSISGTPTKSRIFWIKIETKDKILQLQCYINNNPQLMWKIIPSDELVKRDKEYKAFISSNIDVIAVSHRGRSHAKDGKYRDDDYYINIVDGCTVSIVADGAGSAPKSSTGSKVFCINAGEHLSGLIKSNKDELLEIIKEISEQSDDTPSDIRLKKCLYGIFPAAALYGRQILYNIAKQEDVLPKQYHTTALLSITMPLDNNGYFCAAFQIGDGITAVIDGDDIKLLSKVDSGDFPGETVFVTSKNVFDNATELYERIKWCICKNKPTILSMTDGITDSYFKESMKVDDISLWRKFLSEIQNDDGEFKPVKEICDWLNYYVPQEHDDRTMTIVRYK